MALSKVEGLPVSDGHVLTPWVVDRIPAQFRNKHVHDINSPLNISLRV